MCSFEGFCINITEEQLNQLNNASCDVESLHGENSQSARRQQLNNSPGKRRQARQRSSEAVEEATLIASKRNAFAVNQGSFRSSQQSFSNRSSHARGKP